ncbi:MAG: hypothetical protein H7263_18220 [Candidatus Sericytochromatia bacterium]|nr:hypothetical protein [Candidatus Sericytochromatia bacterium]
MNINKEKNKILLSKKIPLLILLTLLVSYTKSAESANGINLSIESLSVPLGKNTTNDNRQFTFLYGINGYSEISENWRLSYGISGNILNGFIAGFPISIAYVPTGDYKLNLRPQIFAGIEPFYSNLTDFQGFKLYGYAGIGLDYIINDRWVINAGTKVFINDSFFKTTIDKYGFNSGVVSLYGSLGYKFL